MKKMRVGLVSVCSLFLLAACGQTGGMDEPETTTTIESSTETEDTGGGTSTASSTADTSAETDSDSAGSSDSADAPQADLSGGIQDHEFGFSLDDAIAAFRNEYGNVSLESVELKEKRGTYIYEVEGFDDANEYEMDFDAESGEVINKKQESDSTHSNEAIETEGIMTPKEAMDIAVTDAGAGAYVTDWELETENGRTAYEVEVDFTDTAKDDMDITIDAKTGDILDR